MAINMIPVSPPDGSYDGPSMSSRAEVKLFGLSDYGIELYAGAGGLLAQQGRFTIEVVPDHFYEDCYTVALGDILDELVEDASPHGHPNQEAVDEVVAVMEREIAALKDRMALRTKSAAALPR